MDAIETLKLEIMNTKNPKEPEESGQPLMEFLSMKRKYYEDEEGILSDYSSGKEKDLISISADYDKKQKGILEITQVTPKDHHLSFCSFGSIRFLFYPVPIQPCRWGNQEVPLMSPIGSSRFPESAEREKSKEVSEGSTGTESPGTEGMVGLGGLNLKTDPVTLNYHPKQLTQPIWKNNRRSWSPELHERFVEALNILGGVEVATPKQIKEVMQVEGLTNDQVKSHLQVDFDL
ncbi:transcription factor LUX-like [Pistacia vera]|uniref:transcription factor LUX-like n=1 Tax=Pistacia vera TaxID=55513 RepID=UPI00126357D7|nr:transcription factor LUX-like [Pistacia vera]